MPKPFFDILRDIRGGTGRRSLNRRESWSSGRHPATPGVVEQIGNFLLQRTKTKTCPATNPLMRHLGAGGER